ncbi:MAG TPA: recombinase family protein [Pseudonocardiaceae bacterium]|nr:recombinase family protein [Pseudonocardiaceae bacterium]
MSTTRPARSSSIPTPRSTPAIRDLFTAFAACGSAYGVVAAFTGRRFPLRAYGGAWAGQLRWGRLTCARVLGVLKNPCYAGAYVHGRYTSHRSVNPDGTVRTSLIERPRAEWPVLIQDHHEGYLSWAGYLANEAKLAANRTNAGARPPREGSALCQGIITLGSRRQADAHQLPHRCPALLRMRPPRRWTHHPHLPLHHRVHRGQRGGQQIAAGTHSSRGNPRAGRR